MNATFAMLCCLLAAGCDGRVFYSVVGTGPDDVWAVGEYLIAHWDGSGWSQSANPAPNSRLFGIWANGPTDAWIVGEATLHWDGKEWTVSSFGSHSGSYEILNAAWGPGQGDVWAVGYEAAIDHFGGSTPETYVYGDEGTIFTGIAGSAQGDIWAVAWVDGATTHGVTGGKVVAIQGIGSGGGPWSSPQPLRGVWSNGPGDAWAVGDSGIILRWDGVTWSSVPSGTQSNLRGVWASGPSDVWAVGSLPDQATTLHFDGASWSSVPCGSNHLLNAVWGTGPKNVWAAGSGGAILHWDGKSWASFAAPG
jgi:hypothetical protein